MPTDFLANAKPVQKDFLEDAKPVAPKPVATGSISPAPTGVGPWLNDLENDLTGGGSRTVVGRVLGHLQGNGDKGYSGLASGVSPEQAQFMGSTTLGPVHAAQGVDQIFSGRPLKGGAKALGGLLQTATIPSAFVAPEIAEAGGEVISRAKNLLPNTEHAGQLLNEVSSKVGSAPITLTRTTPALEQAQRLSEWGHGTITPLDKLYQRIQTVNPLDYQEARGRYTPLTRLTANDSMSATKQLKSAAGGVARALKDDIGDVADKFGVGDQYRNGMKEYARASKLNDIFSEGKKLAGKALIGGALGAGGYSLGKKLLPGIIPH